MMTQLHYKQYYDLIFTYIQQASSKKEFFNISVLSPCYKFYKRDRETKSYHISS